MTSKQTWYRFLPGAVLAGGLPGARLWQGPDLEAGTEGTRVRQDIGELGLPVRLVPIELGTDRTLIDRTDAKT